MALPVYPRGDLDDPDSILDGRGSFYTEQFDGTEVLYTLYRGRELQYEQVYTNYLEAVNTVARSTIPIYHRENWRPLVFNESNSTAVGDNYRLPLPTGIINVTTLSNRVVNPSWTKVQGIDFAVNASAGTITFSEDIFDNLLIPTRVNASGQTEATLFGYGVDEDAEYIHTHLGYVFGLDLESSENYRDFLNALWDANARGPTMNAVTKAVAAAMDAPVTQQDGEVVESVVTGRGSKYIITDTNVYTYHRNATEAVSVGDVLTEGDTLANVFEVLETGGSRSLRGIDVDLVIPQGYRDTSRYAGVQRELAEYADYDYLYATRGLEFLIQTQIERGEPFTDAEVALLRSLANIPALRLDNDFLGAEFRERLSFPNRWESIVNPTLDSYGNGLRFTVTGLSCDTEQFWAAVDAYGVSTRSLAFLIWVAYGGDEVLLDQLSSSSIGPGDDPTTSPREDIVDMLSNVTYYINPMLFILWQVFGGNAFVLRTRDSLRGPDALPSSVFSKIRDVMPGTAFYYLEPEPTGSSCSSSSSSSSSSSGSP
jgi:hypothetical protein